MLAFSERETERDRERERKSESFFLRKTTICIALQAEQTFSVNI